MANSNNPSPLSSIHCIVDTDVIINWLTKEEELWVVASKILSSIEEGAINGSLTLFTLMEIRFVLRKRKSFSEGKIKEDISELMRLLKVILPDEANILRANELHAHSPDLSPIDALLLAVAMSNEDSILLTRDKDLIKVAKNFLPALTPEDFLAKIKV